MSTTTKIAESIKQFGYLRNRDVAELLFAGNVRKAQRMTKQAVEEGILTEKKTSSGSRFATPDNAALLDNITGHRDAANSILINALTTGIATGVISDRQIQLNQPGYMLAGKLPDGLILDEYSEDFGKRTDYIWLEVENSERSGRDVALIGDWIINQFMSTRNWHVLPEYRAGFLSQILIAVSSKAAEKIESRLISYIKRTYTSKMEVDFINETLPKRLKFIEAFK